MQRFAYQTFLSACVHAQAEAPEGRRGVATGGASPAAKRAERNPWTHSCLNHPAPEGRRKFHGADKTPRSIFKRAPRIAHLLTQRTRPSPLRGERGMMDRLSTGSASGRSAATPLHPWLQSVAPEGRERVAGRATSTPGRTTSNPSRATNSGHVKPLTCPTWLPASGTPTAVNLPASGTSAVLSRTRSITLRRQG